MYSRVVLLGRAQPFGCVEDQLTLNAYSGSTFPLREDDSYGTRLHLSTRPGLRVTDSGPRLAHRSGLTSLPSLPPLAIEMAMAPATVTGERRLPPGFRGQGWISDSRAILPVVNMAGEVVWFVGGEL